MYMTKTRTQRYIKYKRKEKKKKKKEEIEKKTKGSMGETLMYVNYILVARDNRTF